MITKRVYELEVGDGFIWLSVKYWIRRIVGDDFECVPLYGEYERMIRSKDICLWGTLCQMKVEYIGKIKKKARPHRYKTKYQTRDI